MKKIFIVLFSIFITGDAFSQTNSPLNDLEKIVERDNNMFPVDIDGLATGTKAYLEESYYTMICEVNDISIFGKLRDYKKIIKESIIKQLSYDSDFIDTARLLLHVNKEMKYIYVYKPKGWETEIIITKKDLKKMLKK